jgi:hypothetical protein
MVGFWFAGAETRIPEGESNGPGGDRGRVIGEAVEVYDFTAITGKPCAQGSPSHPLVVGLTRAGSALTPHGLTRHNLSNPYERDTVRD